MTSISPPNTISGRSAFIELLKSEGVTRLFGNPGTTELPIMHALAGRNWTANRKARAESTLAKAQHIRSIPNG